MYFTFNRKKQYMQVRDNFISVVAHDVDNITIKLSIDILEAVKDTSFYVKASFYERNPSLNIPGVIQQSIVDDEINNELLIKNIIDDIPDKRLKITNNELSCFFSCNMHPNFSNDVVVTSKENIKAISYSAQNTLKDLVKGNFSFAKDSKSYDSLFKIKDRSVSNSIVNGFSFSKKDVTLNISKIQKKNQSKGKKPKLTKLIKVPSHYFQNDVVYCSFSYILDEAILQREIKEINAESLQRVGTLEELVPPVVSMKQNNGLIFFNITQKDRNATSVQIYRKTINQTGLKSQNSYFHYTTLPLSYNESITINDVDHYGSTEQYIFLSKNSVKLSQDFTLLTTHEVDYRQHLSIRKIICFKGSEGMNCYINDIPNDAISFEVLKRNKTRFEKVWKNLNKSTFLTDDIKSLGSYTFVDSTPSIIGDIYEYSARFKLRNGLTTTFLSNLVENEKVNAKVFNLEIENLKYEPNDITFDVQINEKENNSYFILLNEAIKSIGLLDLYKDRLQEESKDFDKLFVYDVVRIDLSDGTHEYMGTYTDKKYSDKLAQQINFCSKLSNDNIYKYIIKLYFRDPSTLFSGEIDSTRNNPLTFEKGTLYSKLGRGLAFSKNELKHYYTGISTSFDVSMKKEIIEPTIENFNVNVDGNTVSINWDITEGRLVDYFLVYLNDDLYLKVMNTKELNSFSIKSKLPYLSIDDRLYFSVVGFMSNETLTNFELTEVLS